MSFNFNWIDILMACIVVRVIYVAMNGSFLIEIFRNIGIYSAIVISLHYFSRFGQFMNNYLFVPKALHETVAFALIWVTVVLVFKFIADGWAFIVRVKTPPALDKWGGFILGIVRSILTCSLALMFIFSIDSPYLSLSAKRSFTGIQLIDIAPNIYKFTHEKLIAKVFKGEHMNVKVFNMKKTGDKRDKKKK